SAIVGTWQATPMRRGSQEPDSFRRPDAAGPPEKHLPRGDLERGRAAAPLLVLRSSRASGAPIEVTDSAPGTDGNHPAAQELRAAVARPPLPVAKAKPLASRHRSRKSSVMCSGTCNGGVELCAYGLEGWDRIVENERDRGAELSRG